MLAVEKKHKKKKKIQDRAGWICDSRESLGEITEENSKHCVEQQFMSLSCICIPVQSFHDTKQKVHKKETNQFNVFIKF